MGEIYNPKGSSTAFDATVHFFITPDTFDILLMVHLFFEKPANILMSKEFKLTLIDYGNARKIMAPNGQVVDAVGVTEFTGQRPSYHNPWKGLTTPRSG